MRMITYQFWHRCRFGCLLCVYAHLASCLLFYLLVLTILCFPWSYKYICTGITHMSDSEAKLQLTSSQKLLAIHDYISELTAYQKNP